MAQYTQQKRNTVSEGLRLAIESTLLYKSKQFSELVEALKADAEYALKMGLTKDCKQSLKAASYVQDNYC